jgi:2-dehydro-3-deoxyphosphogalactonate aldolase
VGGTGGANIAEWLAAGAEGIGVGGALYKAGDDAEAVGARAKALVEAWRNTTA